MDVMSYKALYNYARLEPSLYLSLVRCWVNVASHISCLIVHHLWSLLGHYTESRRAFPFVSPQPQNSMLLTLSMHMLGVCNCKLSVLHGAYRNMQWIGPVQQLAAQWRRLRMKGIKFYLILVKIEGKTVVKFKKLERFWLHPSTHASVIRRFRHYYT